jgi:hypothetical protein
MAPSAANSVRPAATPDASISTVALRLERIVLADVEP